MCKTCQHAGLGPRGRRVNHDLGAQYRVTVPGKWSISEKRGPLLSDIGRYDAWPGINKGQ